jgi:hypothetical protein
MGSDFRESPSRHKPAQKRTLGIQNVKNRDLLVKNRMKSPVCTLAFKLWAITMERWDEGIPTEAMIPRPKCLKRVKTFFSAATSSFIAFQIQREIDRWLNVFPQGRK